MERINTINARPDANGTGKAGFHDNADISGQDATYISPEWCNHVQEELANVIEGFGEALDPSQKNQVYTVVKGISEQVVSVANRTALIEGFIENIVDFFYPVGIVIDFGIPDFDPNVRFVGTTWVLHGEGKASVGLSRQAGDADWKKSVGNTFGSDTHVLTIAEMPSHNHNNGDHDGILVRSGEKTYTNGDMNEGEPNLSWSRPMSNTGGDQAHNNVQPSIVDARWRRTA